MTDKTDVHFQWTTNTELLQALHDIKDVLQSIYSEIKSIRHEQHKQTKVLENHERWFAALEKKSKGVASNHDYLWFRRNQLDTTKFKLEQTH